MNPQYKKNFHPDTWISGYTPIPGKEITLRNVTREYIEKKPRPNYTELQKVKEVLTEKVAYDLYEAVGASFHEVTIMPGDNEPNIRMYKLPLKFEEFIEKLENRTASFSSSFVADRFTHNRDVKKDHIMGVSDPDEIINTCSIDFGESLLGVGDQTVEPTAGLEVEYLQNLYNQHPLFTTGITWSSLDPYILVFETISVRAIVIGAINELIRINCVSKKITEEIRNWWEPQIILFLNGRQKIFRSKLKEWFDQNIQPGIQ